MTIQARVRFAADLIGLSGEPKSTNKIRLTRVALCALVCLPVLASGAWSQSTQFRTTDIRAALNESNRLASEGQSGGFNEAVAALADFAKTLPNGHPSLPDGHPSIGGTDAADDSSYQSLLNYVQQLKGEQPKLISATQSQAAAPARDEIHSNLMEFAREVEPRTPNIQLAAAAKAAKSAPKVAADAEATFVGSQACMGCHATHAASFNLTVMGRIFRNPRTAQEKGGCETCHGAGSLHVKAGGGRGVGGIISFRKNDTSRPVAENNAICLSCHDKGDRNYWQGSVHESREVACTDCHTVMARVSVRGQLKTEREVETCYQCHKDRRMQSQRSSHMPLREGKMTCTSCHNPHGTANDAMLKQVSVNDNCYQCHAEKRGPFLWEHPPVRENCLNCHEAHGSNLENLLKVQRPRLCQDCHSIGHASQSPLVNTAFNRSCSNCHSQIHGSNHPSGVLFQR
jgi:DmsE family decaheme c-type cytochrome